jgi:proteasome assembly chaperone (PAC2) family protein
VVYEPRVIGAVSSADMRPELERHGVTFVNCEPGAGIVGASGVLIGLGKIHGIDSVCLMGETSGYFQDHRSATAVLKVLTGILGFTVCMNDLEESSKHIEELTEKIREYESRLEDDLGYFR